MIVLDASAALELLLRATDQPSFTRVLESGDTIAAPHLIGLEVTQVLRMFSLADMHVARDSRPSSTVF